VPSAARAGAPLDSSSAQRRPSRYAVASMTTVESAQAPVGADPAAEAVKARGYWEQI